MTGTTRSSHGLDPRRRRALFRAWHRGMREMDLVLGGFADAHLADLANADLADFEALMELPDGALLDWLTDREPVPPEHRYPVFERIRAFQSSRSDLPQ